MELFAFDTLSVLGCPSPESVVEGDALWKLEASRRQAEICAAEDGSPEWLLRSAEFAHETGRYAEAIAQAERAMALAGPGKERIQAYALLIQCMTSLCIADSKGANRYARRLTDLAADSSDDYVIAVAALARETNRQKNEGGMESWLPPCDHIEAMTSFRDTAERFVALGEIDLAIRAHLESARLRYVTGKFFSGVTAIEEATRLAREHGLWTALGRLYSLPVATAADQGYRRGVEEALRRAIAWCDYLGDAYGRVEARISLGRLLGYQMPAGMPGLAREPERSLRLAAEEAEALGLRWLLASADGALAWLFEKAGDHAAYREVVGDEEEGEKDERELLASLSKASADRMTDQIRHQTASRLYDGIQDSLDAFFVFNALRDDTGRCRDLGTAYTNRAADRILEQSGAQIYLYSEARRRPCFVDLDTPIARAIDGRETFEDIQRVLVGESELWYQRRVVPSGDGLVLSLRDVTAEKRIEAALREAAESAERSERTKTAFLASMSHEIRTPLNGVLGLARMLAETGLDREQQAFVDDIVLSGDILLDLIGDVLDLSKIESQEMSISPVPVSLPDTASAIVKLFRGQAQERSTSLILRIEPGVPETVRADGVRLRQILSNLVGNAVKFTREGEVELRVSKEEGFVTFVVSDTGVGIPPDRLDAIFDRFQQASDPDSGGTGLGLTITKALAELMGGDIGVVSSIGQGSTFKVRLPLPEVVQEPASIASPAPLRFDGRRVLLVDDNRVNVLVSSYALRKFGCDVVCVEDGRKALDTFAKSHFDLVLMDVRMPIMNGLEATREIRRREAGGPRTPVVALTAGALLQEQQECYEAGMDDFATKPVAADSIRDVLARWLTAA